MYQKSPFSSFCHVFVTDIQEKGITFAPENSEIVKDNVKQETSHGGSTKKERKQIMMTTVMILTVVAAMIAKAVNVNNNMEMGK